MKRSLAHFAGAMRGQLKGADAAFGAVSTDSRTLAAGELFVALSGPSFDGHDFVGAAAERGAAGVVVARPLPVAIPQIVVDDTLRALQRAAEAWRAQFAIPVVAVAGSNGKTTTKEMLASIMKAAVGDAVLVTQGNFNNDIGMPLTLLKLRSDHRAAVIEMGMNHPGEIAALTRIARPTVAVVTNAQRAHLAGMGTLASIATEKGSIFMGLSEQGVAVFNLDDPWADLWRAQCAKHRILNFSFLHSAEISGNYQAHGLDNLLTIAAQGEQIEVALALPGAHNARNSVAAATAALAAGVALADVRAGLAAFRGIKGRLQRRAGLNGSVLLDDTYNANPDSVRAGIDVLAATIGRKILVLGDMGEIGDMSGQFHDEVGGYAKSQGVDLLFAFGDSSVLAAHNFGAGGRHFTQINDLIDALSGELRPDTTVLVKGSRFMRMERVADALSIAPAPSGGEH